jgi:uncharacterized protein (TIGR02145 family)
MMMIKKLYVLLPLILGVSLNSLAQITGTFTDSRDNKIYKTVTIGTQTWMAENLAFKAKTGCWAYENKEINVKTYGYLYNWETAYKSCPTGWHLPSDDEWSQLIDYLGSVPQAGGKLKETGTLHWSGPNTNATNESGFSALPGGDMNSSGKFESAGKYGSWWSSDESKDITNNSSWWGVSYDSDHSMSSITDKQCGFSVRCIKGNSTKSLPDLSKNPKVEGTSSSKETKVQVETQSKKTFTDTRDGKSYKTVKIGNQTWMAENLCFQGAPYKSVDNEYAKKYGVGYSISIAQNVCPVGWHLPSQDEWEKMFVQVNSNASKTIENDGRYHRWNNIVDYLINKDEFKWVYTFSNSNLAQFETDSTSEFNILATGTFDNPSTSTKIVSQTRFWTSTKGYSYYVYISIYPSERTYGMGYKYYLDISDGGGQSDSFFVRCIKNQER